MTSLVARLLGPVDSDQRISAAQLVWPLFFVSTGRFAYGVDAWVHGSPQMLELGGPTFSFVWSSITVAAATIAIAGLVVTIRDARPRLEMVGSALCCALSIGFTVGVVWNVLTPGNTSSLVAAWQPLALGLVAGWRAHRIGGSHYYRRGR